MPIAAINTITFTTVPAALGGFCGEGVLPLEDSTACVPQNGQAAHSPPFNNSLQHPPRNIGIKILCSKMCLRAQR